MSSPSLRPLALVPLPEIQMRAAKDDLEAQFELGVRFVHGETTLRVDFAASIFWLRKAADRGHAGAQDSLGVRYATGQGVQQDDREAIKWYRKAADQNHPVAQFNLALMYVYGQGVAQDYSQAYIWFSLSASQGDPIAAESRDRVAEALSFEDLEEAKRQTTEKSRQLSSKNPRKDRATAT